MMTRREALVAAGAAMAAVADGGDAPAAEIMDLCDTDVIVLRHSRLLHDYELRHIGESLTSAFPKNRCIILGEGVSVEIVRPKYEA